MTGNLLHFEDFHAGQVFVLGPYEMTEAAIIAFAREFDFQPFHLDKAAAEQSVLGSLSASGWHTASAMTRMMCDAVYSHAEILGSSGIEEMKWLKPVFPGDVLTGTMTITGTRRSASKPEMGVVTFDAFVQDQHGTVKATTRSMAFFKVRAP
ncbi:MAG TPA: MaoC family dehydratase [Aestuariivirga sp.]|nr:MaoC family dehydratase [Aestuariivirga sp.]